MSVLRTDDQRARCRGQRFLLRAKWLKLYGAGSHPVGFDLEKLVRAPVLVPAAASLGDALEEMQVSRMHFVFVVDEHGGIEVDLLEEIVGEINDEYDEETRSQCDKQPDGTNLLDGMLAVVEMRVDLAVVKRIASAGFVSTRPTDCRRPVLLIANILIAAITAQRYYPIG